MADGEAVYAARDKVMETWGAIDAWVNCAMPTLVVPIHELDPRDFKRVVEVTLMGYVQGTKAALVERLVVRCGFHSVIFEASQYEFFALDRRLVVGLPVSLGDLAEAVGGLLRSDQELQPLLPFLLNRARQGRVRIAGLDDQLGGDGDVYANDKMIPELATVLPPQRRAECIGAFRRKAYFDYPEASPYSSPDHEQLLGCLVELDRANKTTFNDVNSLARNQMIQALCRYIGRDQAAYRDQWQARDNSMFQTFNWLLTHGYARGKTIIWAATVHLAKEDPNPKAGDLWLNLGSLMHASFGDRAFVVGFSALVGSYRVNRHILTSLPPAPKTSLEARAFAAGDVQATYLGPEQLKLEGAKESAALEYTYQTVDWADVLDGLVVFREEHPPQRVAGDVRLGSRLCKNAAAVVVSGGIGDRPCDGLPKVRIASRHGCFLFFLDDYVTEANPVRIVEAFIDELDLGMLGFAGVEPAVTGRPAYNPSTLLKIYLYGYLNRVQSSRWSDPREVIHPH